MQSKHNRKIVFSGIDLVGASLKSDFKAFSEVRNTLEPVMVDSGYLMDAPFLWIGMVFRYGLKTETAPHYRRIDKKCGELELAKELDMRVLLTVDEMGDVATLREFFEIATLEALIHAGKKYKRPTEALEARRAQLRFIPEWDPEWDAHPEKIYEVLGKTH